MKELFQTEKVYIVSTQNSGCLKLVVNINKNKFYIKDGNFLPLDKIYKNLSLAFLTYCKK